MHQLFAHLKEVILSFSFLAFLLFSSAAFTSRRIYSTPIAKESLMQIGQGWEALYYVHLFVNFVVVTASYIAIIFHFGFLTFVIVFLLATSISLEIRKSIIASVLRAQQDDPVGRIGMYYKIVTVMNLVTIIVYLLLIYRQYF
ncbi:MAG: hypothetical protein JWQ09_3195 [Segetibacter sp.]|nr:hypothetical protein [Segetibacter sp.]